MGRVLIKFGGGVITSKSTGTAEIKIDVLQSLIDHTVELVKLGHHVIVVHGAGSFGHVLAKQWDLSSGLSGTFVDSQRLEVVEEVRDNMDHLCRHVVEVFYERMMEEGVSSIDNLTPVVQVTSHTPREFLTNTGYNFDGDLSRFVEIDPRLDDILHVTHGDVVDCELPKGFGILSGDHIMYRLATELPDVTHCIFAMDEPGILTSPDARGELIPSWSRDMGINGALDEEMDVTGGIFLKTDVASRISESVEHVWFIDGKCPERMLEIVQNGNTIGTRINPSR